MGDVTGTYTSPNGQTTIGSQLDQSNAALSGAAASAPPPQNPLNMSTGDLGNAIGSTTANLASMQTPQNRGSYVNNSDIPAEQSNFDDLAKQLYNIDKSVIGPNYQQPTSPAPDASGTARVPSSPLALTESALNAPSFNFINPATAIDSNTTQKNSIIDLLGTLNDSLQKEFSSRKGSYASTVQSQKDVLNSLMDVYKAKTDQETQLAMKKMELGIQQIQLQRQRDGDFRDFSDKVLQELQGGTFSSNNPQQAWSDAFQKIKNAFPDYNDEQINEALGGEAHKDSKGAWMGTGNASKDSLNQFAAQSKIASPGFLAQGTGLSLDTVMDKFTQMGSKNSIRLGLLNPRDETAVYINGQKLLVSEILQKAAISGRITQQEINWAMTQFPQWYDTQDSAQAKMDSLKAFMKTRVGVDIGSPTTATSPQGGSQGGNTTQVGRFKVTVH